MTDIYKLHEKAFARVSAYVVLDKSNQKVATVAFKFPADGAGRLYVYVHWIGTPMVRGFAGGYGYDKKSAAVARAVAQIPLNAKTDDENRDDLSRFVAATEKDGGQYWDNRLFLAGFTVLQAI